LFLEQFWLRSGGRLQPRVGQVLRDGLIFAFIRYFMYRCMYRWAAFTEKPSCRN
jgi:hypothetical protein